MGNKILLIIIFLIISQNIFPQWYIQNYAPSPVIFNIAGDGRIFLTYNGIIYSSDISTQNWNKIRVYDKIITSSFFVDSLRGFCGTYYNDMLTKSYVFYNTTDGGNIWNVYNFFFNEYIYSLYFINNMTGWAACPSEIAKTTNSGVTWQTVNTAHKDINSIYMFDSVKGFAINYDSVLYTTNGGLSFSKKYLYSQLIRLKFLNNHTGYILSHFGAYFKTTDGGNNWFIYGSNGNMCDIFFIDENTGWLGGTWGYIYKTTNGGTNWFVQRGRQGSSFSENVKCIIFHNYNTGFAGINDGRLLKTTNGGTNWFNEIQPVNNELKSVSFINGFTGFVVSNNGDICKTTNAGVVWHKIYSVGSQLNDIYTDINNGCFVITGTGEILYSNDLGRNWIHKKLTNSQLYCIRFINSLTGYISGDSGKIFKTTDNGNNWATIKLNTNSFLSSVSFVNENTGWVSAYNSVHKTTNGGYNWFLCDTGGFFPDNNRGIYFIDENTGFLINYYIAQYPTPYSSSRIMKSTNGGYAWSVIYQYNLPPYTQFQTPKMTSLKFFNQNTGYVTVSNGDIINTTNGGYNFMIRKNFFNISVNSSTSVGTDSVWFVGANGLIVSTFDVFSGIKSFNNILPVKFNLLQNYPNPFNYNTNIKFVIENISDVRLSVYDIMGREIETLINKKLSPASYEINWNAGRFCSGVYFCKLISSGNVQIIKLILLK